jgi:hypothetical protein
MLPSPHVILVVVGGRVVCWCYSCAARYHRVRGLFCCCFDRGEKVEVEVEVEMVLAFWWRAGGLPRTREINNLGVIRLLQATMDILRVCQY